jgi:hypothetical protein
MRGSPGPPGGCPVPFLAMISQKQDRANCANAQKSSGPRTPEGKAVSSRNALKSGLYATTLVAHGESKEDFNLLKAQFYRQYQPATPQARLIVDRLIANNWILQRFDHIESEVWQREVSRIDSFFTTGDRYQPFAQAFRKVSSDYARLRRFVASAERAIERQIKMLQDPTINIPADEPPVDPPADVQAPAEPAPEPPAELLQPDETKPAGPPNGFVSSNLSQPAPAASQPPPKPHAREVGSPETAPSGGPVKTEEAS